MNPDKLAKAGWDDLLRLVNDLADQREKAKRELARVEAELSRTWTEIQIRETLARSGKGDSTK